MHAHEIDGDKRKFLKLFAVGAVGLFFGGLFKNGFDGVVEETQFKNFKLVESGKELKLYTSGGEEIVTFEKD